MNSNPTPPQSHDYWMSLALLLAARGLGATRPNPMVGALIVRADGFVIGEGYHQKAGMPHAEIEALQDCERKGHDPRGATMYVTLEPCNHRGRTGPCSLAITAAGLATVIIAQSDPNTTAAGGADALRAAGIHVETGIRRAEAQRLNAAFNMFHDRKRPLVTLKYAMTADGCASATGGDSKWITGEAARTEVHRQRALHDGVLAGIGTVLADGARLDARGVPLPCGQPVRLVFDSDLRLPVSAPLFKPGDAGHVTIFCAEDAETEREAALTTAGASVVRLPRADGRLSVDAFLRWAHAAGLQSIYLEGGRTLAGSFLTAGRVDRVEAWIAPRILGGGLSHLGPLVLPEPATAMADAVALQETTVELFGNDVRLTGWVRR